MSDDAAKKAARDRVLRADARVRKHDAERRELANSIVEARRIGYRPSEIQDWVSYDRNHVGRILKDAGLTQPKGRRGDDAEPGHTAPAS